MFLRECRWWCHKFTMYSNCLQRQRNPILFRWFFVATIMVRTSLHSRSHCRAIDVVPFVSFVRCNDNIMFVFPMQMSMSNDLCVVFHSYFCRVAFFALLLNKQHFVSSVLLFIYFICIMYMCAFGWGQDDAAKAQTRMYLISTCIRHVCICTHTQHAHIIQFIFKHSFTSLLSINDAFFFHFSSPSSSFFHEYCNVTATCVYGMLLASDETDT